MLSIDTVFGIFVLFLAWFQRVNALSYSNSSSTITSAATIPVPPSQTSGLFLDSTTSALSSTLLHVSGSSSNVSDSSKYSLVSITSVSSLHPNGTDPGYVPEPAYMTESSWLTLKSETGGPPATPTKAPLSLSVSTVTNFKQCIASQSSYIEAFSQFTDSVSSAVQAGAYSNSIWTADNVITEIITEIIPEYGWSLAFVTTDAVYSYQNPATTWTVVETETYSYAWTTAWVTVTETLSLNTVTEINTPTFSGTYPICTYVEWPCGGCTIAAASLQLIYWPVSTAEGNPSSTILWNGTTPRVGLYHGTPYTSGSVYLSYAAISAINFCSVLSGGLRTGTVITMASDAVSSLIGDGTYLTAAESFNYANLNYPYNFQAYEQGARHLNCFPGQSGCDVEIEGGYNPYVSLPQQLRDLDPTWASCIIAPDVGSWDPPYALQPIEGTLTPPSPIYTVGPVAGATPISPLAQSTLVSVPIPTAADGQPQPKPWTPVPVPSPTPSKSPVPDSPSADPPMNADPSANVNPPLENPSSSPSPQQTPSDSSPTNPATAQEPTSTPAPQPPPAGPPIIIFHGNPITADSTSAYTIGTQTLVPGGLAITVSSTVLSLAPSATAIAIGGATIPLQFPSSSAPFVITIENTAYTANSASAFTLGTQTLIPGGPAITEAGTMLSLAPSATAIVIGDIAIPLQPSPPPAPQITIGNSIYTANSASAFVIGTQTLLPSGPALTISGTTYSLFPSATALLFDSSTISIAALLVGTSTTLFTLFPGLFTVGNAIYPGTTNAAGALVLSGQTLLPGSAVTLAGTVVSLDAAGTAVVVGGTRTVPVAESGSGVGTVVTSQFGGGYTGLGGVVVSEYGATPTGGSECAVGGSTGAGIGIQRGSGMGATATASGIGTFAGGVGRRGVRCEWVWAAVGVGLVVGGGLGGL